MHIDFYFDFISPFGYFASLRIDELARRHGATLTWRPILLGVSVMKVMGSKPLMEIPLKADYIRTEAARYCRRHGVTLGRSLDAAPMNPLPAARVFNWIAQTSQEEAQAFARSVLRAYWESNRRLDDPEELIAAGHAAQLPESRVRDALENPDASASLRTSVDTAIAKGVFGSPFIVVDGEPFFGVDKLELVDQWLACGGW
ncbi:2-hydroxychromene-2-carboxylate isomerase [Massilia niastensis]|uniref:2-hydroxychromene-2-carboxylate isomerase n=1 Tax=Massilia niastensis TaxID=544911 RepID=UPI000365642F|nr:2-hydroxychromene-2-carboxylate isomerase [Massilia niastensis]